MLFLFVYMYAVHCLLILDSGLLRHVVDFDCADEGMMLTDEDDEYAENWGPCTDSTTARDSYYGTTTMKRTYKSSFILGTFIICIDYVSFVLFSQAAADKTSLQHMTQLTRRLN